VNTSAAARLGGLITAVEARAMAARLTGGETWNSVLQVVATRRRAEVKALLQELGRETSIVVLQAIEAALGRATEVNPIWTMPEDLAQSGGLQSSLPSLVRAARESVVCSTFNVAESSALLTELRAAADRPGVSVTLYLDDAVNPAPLSLGLVTVWRTKPGFRNHAKALVIDMQLVVVTSANLSLSAEMHNVELGLRIDSPALAGQIVSQFQAVEESIYKRVA